MDKQIITFSANEQNLVRIGGEYHYSSNKVSYIGAHFDLGANWDGFDSVRAVWFTDRINGISTVLDGEGNCIVPTEVLKKKDRVFVNLVGSIISNGELTDRLTTYPAVALVVDSKAKVDSTETAPVTPSQFEQFVSIVQDTVANIKDIVSTTLNADYTLTFVYSDGTSYTTPSIRGERGPQGADGADGTDGNGIASAVLNSNYTLTLTFTDGTSYTTPSIRGAQGPKGDPGDVSQAQLDAAVSDLKSKINDTWESVLLESIPVINSSTNWYKSVSTALQNIKYEFVITAETAGTYLFQIGIGESASSMTLTVGEYTFSAGETKTITYTPIGSDLKWFRFYSSSVSLNNTIWSLSIQRTLSGEQLKNTQTNVESINTLIGCKELPTTKGKWYNTSGDTVDINSPNSNSGWSSAVVSCVEGDVFTITGEGGSSPRLWAFVASDGTIISHQDSAVTPSTVKDYILYAPKNSSYFIVNFSNSTPSRLIKGLLVDYRIAIEDYENKITTKRKVVVDASGNGDFTTIQSAINSITDSSFTNQYEIVLKEGTYTEQNLILPPYTYLHGVGQNKPIITSVGLTDYVSVLDCQNTCRIANIKVISGTKYCIHEDVKLDDCIVICENVDFEQTGTSNQTIVGNGAFKNAKFVFNGCTFKGGEVFSHTNSNSVIGVTQHLDFNYCKFDNAGIVLGVSGNVNSNNAADCICKVVGCKGDGVTPLLTCIVPTDNVYPWKVIGGSNIDFSVVYDGETLTGVVNTTDN